MECKTAYPMSSKAACEFVGSMFLVIAAISPIILFYDVLKVGMGFAILADGIAVGFVLFVLIEMFEPISGGHFNPVVTIALMFTDKCESKCAHIYIPAQIAGGLVGVIFSHLMFYHYEGLNIIAQVSDVSRGAGTYVAEFLGTFIFVSAILFLSQHRSKMLSLSIGMLVGGMIIATSSTMFANPQVTILLLWKWLLLC
jgi:glycerol uptake facilitator-like aquaporin